MYSRRFRVERLGENKKMTGLKPTCDHRLVRLQEPLQCA